MGLDVASIKVILFVIFTAIIFISYVNEKLVPEPDANEWVQNTTTRAQGIEHLAKFSLDGQSIIYAPAKTKTGGEYLYYIDPISQQTFQLTDENSTEIVPSYANKTNSIAYLSDRNGDLQIWVRDEKGNDLQVSDSPVSLQITALKWSPDDLFILFQYENEIFFLELSSRKITRLIDLSHKPYRANWSTSGDGIFYSSKKSGKWQIWQYRFSDKKHAQITSQGGYSANQHTNGDLYVSRIHQPGIWKLSIDEESASGFSTATKLFDAFESANWMSWQIVENEIYYFAANEKEKGLFAYELSSKTQRLVFPFDEKYLPYFSVKNDRVIFTILENGESSIEMLVGE